MYEEVEQRRAMLQAVRTRIEQVTYHGALRSNDVAEIGGGIGLGERQAARLYFGTDQEPFLGAAVEDLTDKGLREINVLPPDAAAEGLLAALEEYLQKVEENPALAPEEKERKQTKLRRLGEVVRETATEIGPKLHVEVLSKGLGL